MKIVIAIPLYKNNPEKEELNSLCQCVKILAKYDICFFTHKNLNFTNYIKKDEIKKDYKVEYFDEKNFNNIQSYNELCLNPDFYKRFKYYDYMFLYQLDGWVFKDELEQWCNQGWDYIGAPWFKGFEKADNNSDFIIPSGNGGVSLRNISKFIKILENKKDYANTKKLPFQYFLKYFKKNGVSGIKKYIKAFKGYKSSHIRLNKNSNEDLVITRYFPTVDKEFKIAPPEIALKFSFEVLPERLYKMNNNKLPFACHAWKKYGRGFYKSFIKGV